MDLEEYVKRVKIVRDALGIDVDISSPIVQLKTTDREFVRDSLSKMGFVENKFIVHNKLFFSYFDGTMTFMINGNITLDEILNK